MGDEAESDTQVYALLLTVHPEAAEAKFDLRQLADPLLLDIRIPFFAESYQ